MLNQISCDDGDPGKVCDWEIDGILSGPNPQERLFDLVQHRYISLDRASIALASIEPFREKMKRVLFGIAQAIISK